MISRDRCAELLYGPLRRGMRCDIDISDVPLIHGLSPISIVAIQRAGVQGSAGCSSWDLRRSNPAMVKNCINCGPQRGHKVVCSSYPPLTQGTARAPRTALRGWGHCGVGGCQPDTPTGPPG